MSNISNAIFFLTLLGYFYGNAQTTQSTHPNVILILTDDQGIGDLGCHGNPWLKTPQIDSFYETAIRMTDFHVSPLCTPTRSAIMTGLYPINNGTWATYKGRDALVEDQITMASVFKDNGYQTAMFGKWHLGDNYPSRPTDCGFEVVIQHLAGGIGELSDFWGNSYFNDTYYVNNKPKQFHGYCTDIWFEESMKFIAQNKHQPFFVYLPLNAPHDPLIVEERYSAPYQHLEGNKIIDANLYGMIANIDENFGKLQHFLSQQDLADNTILIFMTDNGTRFGYSRNGELGYNKGYKGIKGDNFEGGHRVPFFIRWPKGNLKGGKDIEALAAHVDLLPTLASLCNISLPLDIQLDGINLAPVLKGKPTTNERLVLLHHRQDWRPPKANVQSSILKEDWRLVNGKTLFDIEEDPYQQNNLINEYPEVKRELLAANERFIQKAMTNKAYFELPVSTVGHPDQIEIKLTIQHAIGEDKGIWKAEQIASGIRSKNNTHALKIEEDGIYEISCRRWPKECPGPIWGIPDQNPKKLFDYRRIQPQKVRIRIANQIIEKVVNGDEEAINFRLRLQEGKTLLVNDFVEGDDTYGVYYTYLRKVTSTN